MSRIPVDKIVELGLEAAYAANHTYDLLAYTQRQIDALAPVCGDTQVAVLIAERNEGREAFDVLSYVVGMTVGYRSLGTDSLHYPTSIDSDI